MSGAPARSAERDLLADSFTRLGASAPTILPGWDAADLLEHLMLREGAPHLVVGRRLPGPVGRAARREVARRRDEPWRERVVSFRAGPGRASVAGRIDAFSGQGELLIHHEDLLRAQDGWEPRRLSAAAEADAWRAVGLMAPLMVRLPLDVTLVSPLGGRRLRAREARGTLRVHGSPMELLLWVSGRARIARVRLHGDAKALRLVEERERRRAS